MAKPQVAIQLYSVRDRSERDFLGTIREIADIGYKNVEFAGYYGHPVADVKKVLQETGLNANSAHVGLSVNEPDKLEENLKQQVEYALELGIKRFVVPYYPISAERTQEEVDQFIATLEKASAIVTAAGLEFGYHNHDFEFRPIQGSSKLVIDEVFDRLPASKIFAEFDLGWVKVAGQDPAAYIEKYAGRLPLVHAKDFKADGKDTEIGKGTVDWDAALAAAEKAGVEYIIIEQEQYDVDSLTSAKLNFEWFKARGWV